MTNQRIGRRDAMKGMLVAGVAPLFVPSHVFGASAPSNMIRLGTIGTGRMGRGDMQSTISHGLDEERHARMVAVCDVDLARARSAAELVRSRYEGGEVDVYTDYRELLARADIDGVLISTPEHWHALIAIEAARAKKDMYVQKPLTYSVGEGKALVKAVRENGVILQTGTQQRSDQRFRRVCELVRNGRLGKLEHIHVQVPRDSGVGNPRPMDVPANLNFDMWQGPKHETLYTEDRVHPREGFGRPGWLQIQKYCLGMITGWGTHMFDIAQWAHGTDVDSGPVEMRATGAFPDRGLFDVHTSFEAEGVYADGVRLTAQTHEDAGVRFNGSDGWVFVRRGGWEAHDRQVLREEIGEDGIQLYRSLDHYMNFLDCMRSRAEPICPVEVGHRSNTICVMTHIAMKLGRKLHWDPQAERFIDDDDANAMLDYDHREPWTL